MRLHPVSREHAYGSAFVTLKETLPLTKSVVASDGLAFTCFPFLVEDFVQNNIVHAVLMSPKVLLTDTGFFSNYPYFFFYVLDSFEAYWSDLKLSLIRGKNGPKILNLLFLFFTQ